MLHFFASGISLLNQLIACFLYPFFKEKLRLSKVEILVSLEKDQLTGLLRNADLYLGHDSGITHLAAMFGTPTIALFKESDVNQWRPLGPCVRVVRHNPFSSGAIIEEVLKALKDLHFPWIRPSAGRSLSSSRVSPFSNRRYLCTEMHR